MARKIRRAYQIQGVECWVCGDTEQEVMEKVLSLYGIGNDGQKGRSCKTHPFGQYAMDWFQKFSAPNVERVTRITYKRQLDRYIIPSLGSKNVEDICVGDVQELFNSMTGAKSTKDKCRVVLNMIFNLAMEERLIDHNPMKSGSLKIKGASSKTTEPYSVEDMRYFVAHIGDLKRVEDIAYMALHTMHPLRLEEVLGLKWGDIDLEAKVIHVRRAVTHPDRNRPQIKETKTGEGREIGLTAKACEYLRDLKKSPDEFVIGGSNAVSYVFVRRMCERVAKEIRYSGKITPMRFRPTVLTDIYNGTGDIKLTQLSAGHRNVTTTLKHYVSGRRDVSESAEAIQRAYQAISCKPS